MLRGSGLYRTDEDSLLHGQWEGGLPDDTARVPLEEVAALPLLLDGLTGRQSLGQLRRGQDGVHVRHLRKAERKFQTV